MSEIIKELNEHLVPVYSELVGACIDYTEGKVDYIYILGVNVANSHYVNQVFFEKNGELYDQLNIGGKIGIEITDGMQRTLLYRLKAFKDMYNLYIKYTGESPTEVKIKYDVNTSKFGMNLSYDDRIEKSRTLTPNYVLKEWYEATKSGEDGFDW